MYEAYIECKLWREGLCVRVQGMRPFIDKNAISKHQQRVANKLLPADHVLHEIMDRLLARLDLVLIKPETILNYGWHSLNAELQLKNRYPESVVKNSHDLKTLQAMPDCSVDLVIAHFALLRERDPIYLLHEFSRVLSEEGLLLFTSLGPDTLIELRQSFLQVDRNHHVHPFTDMHDIGDWMKQLHLSDPVVDREEIILAYDDINLIFEDLKNLGATNVHEFRQRGLLSKNKWQAMLSNYEQYKTQDYFPVTLEIIYGHGWKVKVNEDTEMQNEVFISVDSVRRK